MKAMQQLNSPTTVHLIIHCADKVGIIAAITQFLHQLGANIIDLDQHVSHEDTATFFMRVAFTVDSDAKMATFAKDFEKDVAQAFQMSWQHHMATNKKRMAIFVSKPDHALLEILWRWQQDELAIEIPLIISNHTDAQKNCEYFGVPFHHIPVNDKPQAEQKALELLQDIDGIILARYMQIISPNFIAHFPGKMINIHHSFLPAFSGASPYQQAFDKGVKLIGATAHFVTEELDEGPIIAQDVVMVNHRHSANDLKQLGKNIERNVLAKAVSLFAEDRIILNNNKTIVFE